MKEIFDNILEHYNKAQKEVGEIQEAENIIEDLDAQLDFLVSVQQSCQIVASSIQTIAHQKIAGLVTKCLSTIFDDPYEFEILFEEKRGKTEARPIFKRRGEVIEEPLKGSGGGVVDVAAFALRLASIILSKPKPRKILILDEPFKFVSEKYRKNIAGLLNDLSNSYGIQIIMVTHINELKAGQVACIE